MTTIDTDKLFCPLQEAVTILNRKWALPIINEVGNHEQIRFNELAEELKHITAKNLSDTLKKLEEDNVVCKKIFDEVLQRSEYSLTKEGFALYQIVMDLLEWNISRKNAKLKQCICSSRPERFR